MKCPECGSEITGNEVFCENCGAEIITADESTAAENYDAENKDTKEKKKGSKKKKTSGRSKPDPAAVLKITAIIILVILLIVVIILAVNAFKASEGRRIFDKVPLGRNADMIGTETQADFSAGKSSAYGALNYIADYDYICESEKAADVSGIQLPEWAVLVSEDGSGNISEAALYNFKMLKYNWMGEKTASKIEISSVKFGAKIKEAERIIGLKPYTIIKENSESTISYTYRYHYTDETSGNNCVMNIYVVVNEVDGTVRDVYEEQLDYLNFILKGVSDRK